MPIPEWVKKWIDKEDEEVLYTAKEATSDPGDIGDEFMYDTPLTESLPHHEEGTTLRWDTPIVNVIHTYDEHSDDFIEWREDYGD